MKTETGKADSGRSSQASGYATDSHDQVIHASGRVVGECWTQTDALAISAELNRLLEWIKQDGEHTGTCVYPATGQVCSYCQCKRSKSHNDEVSGRASENGGLK